MRQKILSVVAVAALFSGLAFAEVRGGDSRARGMSGAMTALNDDMNTLFYNPAGLAYLRKSYFIAQADLAYVQQMGCLASALPEVQFISGSKVDWTDVDQDGDYSD